MSAGRLFTAAQGKTPSAVIRNKNEKFRSFNSKEKTFIRKKDGPDCTVLGN